MTPAALLFLAATAEPAVRSIQLSVLARARIIEAVRIDMSGRTATPRARKVRRGLIEFE